MPELVGSTKPRTALAATAASIAAGEAGSRDPVAGVDVGAVEFFSAGGLELWQFLRGRSVGLAEGVRGADGGHGASGG